MDNRFIDFHTGLANAKNKDAIWRLLLNFVQAHGLEHLNTWFGTCRSDAQFFTNRPNWWTPHYLANKYYKEDHLVRHFFIGNGLLPYSLEHDEQCPDTPEQAVKILREARTGFNLGAGVAFPLFTPAGNRIGGVNISSAGNLADFDRLPTSNVLASISATTAALTQIYTQNIASFETPHLTPREQECLLWLSKGLRTKEISDELNLSDHTATFHINNAKAKLGAETREQAVARAVVLGLIVP